MYIRYNGNQEKIVMGLLSYIPEFKNMARLKQEMEAYEQEENRSIYLWRNEETHNAIALVGIEEADQMILVRHLSITPSFREEGLIYHLLDQLNLLYPNHQLNGTLETNPILVKWREKSHAQK